MIEMITTTTQTPFAKPWGNYLLEKIVETQTPQSISWLPQTLGWKLLAGITLLLLVSSQLFAQQQFNGVWQQEYSSAILTISLDTAEPNNITVYNPKTNTETIAILEVLSV